MRRYMIEKERMLKRYPYRFDDPLLSKERMRVRKLIKRYDTSAPSKIAKELSC